MAFKMTFPTIKGSPIHKEATSVVPQSRTSADPSLIYAADEMGKSTVPGAIDYEIKGLKELKFRNTKSKPNPTEEEKWFRDRGENAENNQLTEDEFFEGQRERQGEKVEDKFDDIYAEEAYKDYTDHRTEEERETFKKKRGEDEEFKRAEEAYNKQKEEEESSAIELRKQSVFKNAIKGGKIQKELIKQGFDPYK